MKKTRVEILALFNLSKSGKSYLLIQGDQMFLVSLAIMEQVKRGEVASLTFAKDGELLSDTEPADPANPTGPKKKEFDTLRPVVIEQSLVAKLQEAAAIVAAGDQIDTEKLAKYIALGATMEF